MIAERLTAQLLAGPPARDPVAVAERLLAVQGQDPRGARLAIRARTTGLSAADVDRDLAKWSGLGLRDVRAGLNAIATELYEREDGLLQIAGRPDPAESPPPRLLGSFDPVLLGWASREWLLDAHRAVITVNGLFRPFALAGARAVATWSMPAGEVVLDPFGRLKRKHATALQADALDVVRYLGDR